MKDNTLTSVSSISAAAPALAARHASAAAQKQRAEDGDYLKPGINTSSVKDADGDYKPSSPALRTSSATLQAMNMLNAST